MAQWDMCLTGGQGFDSHVQQHSFVEIDREIFFAIILSLLPIQAYASFWQKNVHKYCLSFSGLGLSRMCGSVAR